MGGKIALLESQDIVLGFLSQCCHGMGLTEVWWELLGVIY